MNENDSKATPNVDPKIQADRQLLQDAKQKGKGAQLGAFFKLSGPGWLQGAITLGGGSLAGSLYVGVIGGYQFMWLQPLLMILGIVMLSSIAYVTLSTGKKPFRMINQHVSPVLGWGWLIAAMLANLVWAMPQFSLGTAALQQNLGLFTGDSFPDDNGKYISVGLLFVIATVIVWFYESGGWGIKLFDIILKVMVAGVVLSFFGVVAVLATKGKDGLPWGDILAGFIPDPSLLTEPADKFKEFIAQSQYKEFWTDTILRTQRDIMMAAAATAVGINMTFLLPYSMLRKGWDKTFRGLATFDLSTGLFIPFLIATSCVVIASATQFHGTYDKALIGEAPMNDDAKKLVGSYHGNLDKLILHNMKLADPTGFEELQKQQKEHDKMLKQKKKEMGAKAFADATKTDPTFGPGPLNSLVIPQRASQGKIDKQLSTMLIKRDAFALANSLEDLMGKGAAQYVFGIGVLGMAISTIIILMLINGFTFCEMIGVEPKGAMNRLGAMIPGITGVLGFLLLWGDDNARFWLAVPTSVFGMVLLPIAYVTFFLMMNNRNIMGDNMLTSGKRTVLNVVMLMAIAVAGLGSGYAIWAKTGWYGIGGLTAFIVLALLIRGKGEAESSESRLPPPLP